MRRQPVHQRAQPLRHIRQRCLGLGVFAPRILFRVRLGRGLRLRAAIGLSRRRLGQLIMAFRHGTFGCGDLIDRLGVGLLPALQLMRIAVIGANRRAVHGLNRLARLGLIAILSRLGSRGYVLFDLGLALVHQHCSRRLVCRAWLIGLSGLDDLRRDRIDMHDQQRRLVMFPEQRRGRAGAGNRLVPGEELDACEAGAAARTQPNDALHLSLDWHRQRQTFEPVLFQLGQIQPRRRIGPEQPLPILGPQPGRARIVRMLQHAAGTRRCVPLVIHGRPLSGGVGRDPYHYGTLVRSSLSVLQYRDGCDESSPPGCPHWLHRWSWLNAMS